MILKNQLMDWLSQGKIRKIVDALYQQHPGNKDVILISARTYTYLQNSQDGVELNNELRSIFATLIRDLIQIVNDLYPNIVKPVAVSTQETKNELNLNQKIEAYYQTMVNITCRVKSLNLTKRETQDMVKFLSAQMALLHLGTEIPPPYLDKPSMPPNTKLCCKVCRESDIQLEGNDQCPNCKLSTYAWM